MFNEVSGDIWSSSADFICVTTNGDVLKSGKLVMGKGIAKQARDKFDGLDLILGQYVSKYGNRAFIVPKFKIISFPTKHSWKDKLSSIDLIRKSAIEIVQIANKYKIESVASPRPGCGNGGRMWLEIKLFLVDILDKRFTIYNN